MSLDYLNAFRGIPSYPSSPGVRDRDLADVLRERRGVRGGAGVAGVVLSVHALQAIAQRIHDQSAAVVALQAGGPALGPDDLAAHEAEREAAAGALRTGILVRCPGKATENPEGETPVYEGLYDHDGRFVAHNGGDPARTPALTEGWNYTRFTVPTLFDNGRQAWPGRVAEVQRIMGEARNA